jgi:glycosyltransferase involved in cell wall biosynthesis
MESVLNQTSHDFEYIVVDGAAPLNPPDRGTLKKFVQEGLENQKGFQRCIWLSPFGGVGGGFYSEPDSGIYNAMNKGIRMAKGDYIHFLNSGDWLVDEHVVEKMLEEVKSFEFRVSSYESEEVDILVGNVMQIRSDGKVRKTSKPTQPVSLLTFYTGTIQHTSAYIRRVLFEQYGLYDENLKIVSDWKWYMQVAGLNRANVVFTDLFVTCFDMSGISSTNLQLDKAERRQVLEELIPATILADYDRYHFDIDQMERIKKHRWLYRLFWFAERVYFKIDKWNAKYWGWKK